MNDHKIFSFHSENENSLFPYRFQGNNWTMCSFRPLPPIKSQGSNIIVSTSFALVPIWSRKIMVDIIQSNTMTVSQKNY